QSQGLFRGHGPPWLTARSLGPPRMRPHSSERPNHERRSSWKYLSHRGRPSDLMPDRRGPHNDAALSLARSRSGRSSGGYVCIMTKVVMWTDGSSSGGKGGPGGYAAILISDGHEWDRLAPSPRPSRRLS